jgi:hypothetical protein
LLAFAFGTHLTICLVNKSSTLFADSSYFTSAWPFAIP